MERSSLKIRNFLIFQEEFPNAEKQTKSALKKFLASYEFFVIFTAVNYKEILPGYSLRKFPVKQT